MSMGRLSPTWILLFILAALLCACDGAESSKPVPQTIHEDDLSILLQRGDADHCEVYVSPEMPEHESFLCRQRDGYHYRVDIPHDDIHAAVIMLHGADMDAAAMRAMTLINTEPGRLDNILMIVPSSRNYPVFTRVRLWNGSGERAPGDNGCCVDNGLDDREFIKLLAMALEESLPRVPRFLVGLSNGGMLALDLMFNESFGFGEYFILMGSDQTRERIRSTLPGAVTLVVVRDDEVVPFFGGEIAHTTRLQFINADNPLVIAPPFSQTLEKIKEWKSCDHEADMEAAPLDQGSILRFACADGPLTVLEIAQGGHWMGSESLAARTPQRREVIGLVLDHIDTVLSLPSPFFLSRHE